jgi:alanyl-tRNA synthetase
MKSSEIRQKFLNFFAKRGHTILPSSPLVPENDPTVLFNTAGMQPLVPYLMGKPHPQGDKLANIQKCVRTTDIEDVGDNTHLTFFEMMGNWSLGSYFKEDAIRWSYELLTSKSEGFGLDPKRLYVTVFKGDTNAPEDIEAAKIWESVGMPKNRIYFKDASANWWPAVKGKDTWTGPTGPCSEMFYDLTRDGLGDLFPEEYNKADEEQKVVEIWNDVFMEYEKKDGKIIAKLNKKNVDTGAGFERLTAVLQGKDNVFDTDIFSELMSESQQITDNLRSARIISDHIRSSIMLIADGVVPSNSDQGYVLRRLIRRAIFNSKDRNIRSEQLQRFVDIVSKQYEKIYPNVSANTTKIVDELVAEHNKFAKTIEKGLKILRKDNTSGEISGKWLFDFYQTYGFPKELVIEEWKKVAPQNFPDSVIEGLNRDFNIELEKHQALSRSGSEKKFKGGLGDDGEMSVRYHTATHLLHQALHDVLGDSVGQKGSNITSERLRFDFSYPTKMTDEQKQKVEAIVNQKIAESLPVQNIIMPKAEAEKTGARRFFGDKYGDDVSIYYVGESLKKAYSKEFCGGPHVANTIDLAGPDKKWTFKIQKEEAVSQGVRRIKAVLG